VSVAGARRVTLSVNGEAHTLEITPDALLLHVLRNDLALNGPKYGCGLAQCGACTVIIEGLPARSCVLPAAPLEGLDIVTLEGLGTARLPHPVQQAFIEHIATQCGYCLNGMIMTIASFLKREPHADEIAIREALRYNLCRCGSHVDVLAAALTAAERLRTEAGA
jgi:nicotinate dehydrogenase subunit A